MIMTTDSVSLVIPGRNCAATIGDCLAAVVPLVGETPLDEAGVKAVAAMPSREELIASIVGCIGAPAGNLVSAIGAPAANIAGILTTLEEREGAEYRLAGGQEPVGVVRGFGLRGGAGGVDPASAAPG